MRHIELLVVVMAELTFEGQVYFFLLIFTFMPILFPDNSFFLKLQLFLFIKGSPRIISGPNVAKLAHNPKMGSFEFAKKFMEFICMFEEL